MNPFPDGQLTYPLTIHLYPGAVPHSFLILGTSEQKTGLQPGGYHPEVVYGSKPAHCVNSRCKVDPEDLIEQR